MSGNAAPIFSKIPDNQWLSGAAAGAATPGVTANTTKDLTAGTINLIFTADATNGGRVDKLVAKPLGTNGVTIMRVWVNNGATTATAANNTMVKEVDCVATTLSESTGGCDEIEVPLDLPLAPGYRLYVTFGTAVAAGFHVTGHGGKY